MKGEEHGCLSVYVAAYSLNKTRAWSVTRVADVELHQRTLELGDHASEIALRESAYGRTSCHA